MSLQSHKAIILFGAPVPKDQATSQNLQNLGINLLRLKPSDVKVKGHPTLLQPRYGTYISNLPGYIEAMTYGRDVNGAQPYYPISTPNNSVLVPITFPDVIFDWSTKVSDDIIVDLQARLGGQTFKSVVKGKRGNAFVAKLTSWEDVKVLMTSPNINLITPAFVGTTNLNGYRAILAYQRFLYRLLSLHAYPAFADHDHFLEYVKFKNEIMVEELVNVEAEDDDEEMEEADPKGKGKKVAKVVETKKEWTGRFTKIDEKRGRIPPQEAAGEVFINDIDDLPNNSGLFAPYYSDVHHFDNDLVPKFIDNYLNGCLGENESECSEVSEMLRGFWGVACKTDAGTELTHLALCLDIALRCQARALPFICRSKGYAGCFILGAGFEVEIEATRREPQSRDELISAFNMANTHARGIRLITALSGGATYWNDRSTNTMEGMRKLLLASPLQSNNREAVIQAAKLLDFKEDTLKINHSDIVKALSLLVSADPIPDDYPIHWSKVLETDRTMLIWSGFGHFAPTFKVPGGRLTDLASMETVNTVQVGKGSKERMDVRRIGVKTIPLDLAVADLRWVIENKKIMTPFKVPGATKERVSTEHFTRFLAAEGYNDVVGLLRKLSGTSSGSINAGEKRRMEGAEDEGGIAKKKRGFMDV